MNWSTSCPIHFVIGQIEHVIFYDKMDKMLSYVILKTIARVVYRARLAIAEVLVFFEAPITGDTKEPGALRQSSS